MESESESSSSDEIEEVNDKFHVQMGKRKNSRIYLANRKEVEKERGVRRKKKRPGNRFRITEGNVKENQKNLKKIRRTATIYRQTFSPLKNCCAENHFINNSQIPL